MSNITVQCYNKGCGQKFDPVKNSNDSCTFHPGPPQFHDAYKIWTCCNKKSTDFSTWLSYKGCTKSFHNPEKPVDAVKIIEQNNTKLEKPEEIVTWSGLNKPVERPTDYKERKLLKLCVKISDSLIETIKQFNEENIVLNNESNLIGAPCKNNSCKETYKGTESDQGSCHYHPGTAIFHEGLKYWSCCQKKTSNFSAFLDQVGCESGNHCWKKTENIVDKIREDWFSRNNFIYINIYCKGLIPKQCEFLSDGFLLKVKFVYNFGNKEGVLDYNLWGEILPDQSHVVLNERKIELVLKKATIEVWPKLIYTSEIESNEKK